MAAKIISFINLKGGVAKTTTTVGVATVLSGEKGKRVLVIDLDPQTNCTTMLIGEEKWQSLNAQGYTLCSLFQDALDEKGQFEFNLPKTLQKGVSGIRDVTTVDLIPSSLDIIDLQDQIATMPSGSFYSFRPIDIIYQALQPILNNYDYVLIDCPPNMGVITLNGLRMSNGYIIPTIPDVLSTYGIPQIIQRVARFSRNISRNIPCLGIVATKVRKQSNLHSKTMEMMRHGKDKVPVFKTIFYENNHIAEIADYVPANTLKQKWGYQGQLEAFSAFVDEIMERMEH